MAFRQIEVNYFPVSHQSQCFWQTAAQSTGIYIGLTVTKQHEMHSNKTKFLSQHQLRLCQVTQVDDHQQILQQSQQTLFMITMTHRETNSNNFW